MRGGDERVTGGMVPCHNCTEFRRASVGKIVSYYCPHCENTGYVPVEREHRCSVVWGPKAPTLDMLTRVCYTSYS